MTPSSFSRFSEKGETYIDYCLAKTALESPILKLKILFPKIMMTTTVEPLSSVLISLSRSCLLVLRRQLVTSSLSSGMLGAVGNFFKELFRFSLHLVRKVLRRFAFMKADTRCPLSPCPSQTLKSFIPKGIFISAIAIS